MLAGAVEPAGRIVQQVVRAEGGDACRIVGTTLRASATGAALANGTAAHALDFDDMCFVSLAHPSAPLFAAVLAAAEVANSSGSALLDAYVVGFEVEARLGARMNPRHYQRGWHCTSTLGAIGAAAGVSRVLGLDPDIAARAIAIAASDASGLKENFGTMVKPLHAGLAARSGVLAGLLAREGLDASLQAIDGPQGFLHAMNSEHDEIGSALDDLGSRWEILDTGITVKLYPSCAGTHPTLDVLLDVRRQEHLGPDDIECIEVVVDSVTPKVLIHDRPSTGLEAKFSLPFCAAAAIVFGHVGVETFDDERLRDPRVVALMPRVVMRAEASLDGVAAPLTQARITITRRDGRTIVRSANGARGYPDKPASGDELGAKFLSCAERVLAPAAASRALAAMRAIEGAISVRELIGPFSARGRASKP
jgi:2-methylcitrate dehydratase PrpD